ncbi:hypothetical protein FB451DRAFT_1569850 [Mycena latifolia]|nr:hypothetical protein FB451DRAFT_1569850 [Mycena latifolia]
MLDATDADNSWAEHDPRCRHSSRPSTISANASGQRVGGLRAALRCTWVRRTFYCKQEHHCKFDKSAPDSSGSDPAVAPNGSCNNHMNLSHDDDTGACRSGKDNKGAGLAYNQYKPLFDLLASPPLLALKYHQQVEAEENGLIDDGSVSTTTAPAVSVVAHLSFAGAQLAGVRDLDDVGVGVQRLEERDGLLGFGEGLGGGGNDEKDLFDLLDAVAVGEADEVSTETTGSRFVIESSFELLNDRIFIDVIGIVIQPLVLGGRETVG